MPLVNLSRRIISNRTTSSTTTTSTSLFDMPVTNGTIVQDNHNHNKITSSDDLILQHHEKGRTGDRDGGAAGKGNNRLNIVSTTSTLFGCKSSCASHATTDSDDIVSFLMGSSQQQQKEYLEALLRHKYRLVEGRNFYIHHVDLWKEWKNLLKRQRQSRAKYSTQLHGYTRQWYTTTAGRSAATALLWMTNDDYNDNNAEYNNLSFSSIAEEMSKDGGDTEQKQHPMAMAIKYIRARSAYHRLCLKKQRLTVKRTYLDSQIQQKKKQQESNDDQYVPESASAFSRRVAKLSTEIDELDEAWPESVQNKLHETILDLEQQVSITKAQVDAMKLMLQELVHHSKVSASIQAVQRMLHRKTQLLQMNELAEAGDGDSTSSPLVKEVQGLEEECNQRMAQINKKSFDAADDIDEQQPEHKDKPFMACSGSDTRAVAGGEPSWSDETTTSASSSISTVAAPPTSTDTTDVA